MSYRAVIFDLFYTLLYDEGTGTREKAIEVARAAGIAEDDWLRNWRATSGLAVRGRLPTLSARVRKALEGAGIDDPAQQLVDNLSSLLLARQTLFLYPDTRGTLAEVRRRGYLTGLTSNLYSNEVAWLRELELHESFDAVVLSCEVGLMKPDPGIYLMSAERLGLSPQECVFVDDVPSYVAGAMAVGMTGVRINRFGSEEPYAEHEDPGVEPDLRIGVLDELVEWLPERAGA